MKKSKLFATIVLVVVLAVCGAAFAACKTEQKHEHTYATDWSKDESGHWHVATCDDLKEGDKDYKKDFAAHVWGDDDECDICHYTRTPAKVEYTVTFSVGEHGTLPAGTANTAKTVDGKLSGLPTPTAKTGYTFEGWFDAAQGGNAVTSATVFTKDTTIHAHYKAVKTEYTVTLDAAGGTLAGDKETDDVETVGGKIANLPTPTAPAGMEFIGWFTEEDGGDKVTADTAFREDATIYAQYVTVFTVTLNANGGTVDPTSIKAVEGNIESLPTPTAPAGKQFIGWFTAADGGVEVTVETNFEEDTTIYAHYASVYTVTLNVGTDGTLPEGTATTLTTVSGKLAALPTPATANAIVFVGWFTAADGGEQVTTDTLFTGDTSEITLYARYRQEILVTFTVGEGTLPEGVSATMTTTNNKIAELPEPTAPAGKWFQGWYTAETEGTKVWGTTNLSEHADNEHKLTLYARYVANVTVTLDVGTAGTLPEGAVTTYKTENGKIVLPEGQRGLPAVSTGKEHYVFFGWYNGTTAIKVEETIFDKDTTLTAKVGREDGIWVGENFIHGLTLNAGASRTEYWLGGSKITLKKGDVMTIYMNGIVVNHFVEPNSAGIVKPAESAIVGKVTVEVAGEFEIYLHRNAQDWSCQYSGPTEVIIGSDIPAGCDAISVKIGTNEPIMFFVKDGSGNGVSKADFSKYCIYTYQDEIFGNWNASSSQGKLKEEIIVDKTTVPSGWIFRWGSNYSQQTADIKGVFKAGKTYLVELPKSNKGSPKITELTITSVYTITLDQNYAGQPETKETTKAYNGKLSYLPTFVREGFEDKDLFWYTAAEGGEKVTTSTVFTADATIYARWSEKVVATIDQNYTGKPENTTQKLNLGKFDTLPTATREDYDFMGWFTAADGGEEVTTSTVFDTNSTIYAHWQPKKVITVDLNYTDKPENTTVKANHGKLTTLPAAPTRDGYEFMGWFDAAEEGNRITTATEFTADSTIYAHWRVPFKVTLNLNYENCPEPIVITANVVNGQTYSRIPALPEAPVYDGYELVGWYPNADGTGTKLGLFTNITEDTTYYALWRVPFKVTLDLNYENCPEASVKTAKIVSGTMYSRLTADDIAAPVQEGFEFLGRFPNADGTGARLTTTTNLTADATYYAKWRVPFKVTFNLNYENCADPTVVTAHVVEGQTYSLISEDELPASPEREGYAFMGWYTVQAETGGTRKFSRPGSNDSRVTADTVVYARWRLPYKVTFNLNYTDCAEPTVIELPLNSSKIPEDQFPADPVREGYEFMGWFTKSEGGAEISKDSNFISDSTLYAHWRTPVTVTFDLNYEGKPDTVITLKTAGRGKLAAFPEDPVRDGYVFAGWWTQPTSLNSIGVPEYYTFGTDMTVYARWAKKLTVTFDLNYEGQPEEKATATGAEGYTLKDTAFPETPVRAGYTFAGWFTEKEGGTEVVAKKTTFQQDTTVYAHWTKVEQTPDQQA